MLAVAIKFCGGCNPTFDRVEYWDRIRRSAGGRVTWVRLCHCHFEALLPISGCQRACPEHDFPPTVRLVSLKTNEMDPDSIVRILVEKENVRENCD
jgi:hypothetical protein